MYFYFIFTLFLLFYCLKDNSNSHFLLSITKLKQVYIYGGLDRGPITLNRNFGFAWGVNGFLLFNTLGKLGTKTVMAMRKRVADEITTTFASHYINEVSLLA